MLPLAFPDACGANVTERLALCCGAIVSGRLGPANVKLVPETRACEIVTFDLPPLLTVIGTMRLLPIGTLPRFTVVDVNDICPAAEWALKKTEMRTTFEQAELHRNRSLMMIGFLSTCSSSTAGDMEQLRSVTRCSEGIATGLQPFHLSADRESTKGHEGTNPFHFEVQKMGVQRDVGGTWPKSRRSAMKAEVRTDY